MSITRSCVQSALPRTSCVQLYASPFAYRHLNGRDVTRRMKDNDMSNDIEHYRDPSDKMVALYLANNDGDELTDALVAALEDAFRILRDEISGETMH